MQDNRKFAIYSRKSRFTGKGESIENQVELCRSYIMLHDPETKPEDIIIFEDEGFSGGNTNRPQLQQMMKLCREKKIRAVVCYRLDRISRNTGDFIKLFDELNHLNIDFLSVRDHFDTSGPMGRAMIFISSIFAQLERETIAERIRDNMYELAKDGRWLGGTTPIGYRSTETIGSYTFDGRERKAHKLEIILEEAEIVRLLFRKFLEFNSLTKLDEFCINQNIRTRNGKQYSRNTLKPILQNPVYMIADEAAWDYFHAMDAHVYADRTKFDGAHGVIAYNKTDQNTGGAYKIRDISEWIIAVGKHEGIISGEDWVKVQKLIDQNKSKSFRKPRSNVALLSGLLVCGNCGSYMRPKLRDRKNKDGERVYEYLCELKERSRGKQCSVKTVNGNTLDSLVCGEIKKLSDTESVFVKRLRQERRKLTFADSDYDAKTDALQKEKADIEKKIRNLMQRLADSEGTAAGDYIIQEVNALDEQRIQLQVQIDEYTKLSQNDAISGEEFEHLISMLSDFAGAFETLPIEQKRSAIRAFLKRVVWDGNDVHLYFFGAEDDGNIPENGSMCQCGK